MLSLLSRKIFLFALTAWLDLSLTAHQKLISHPLGVKKLTSVKITKSFKNTNIGNIPLRDVKLPYPAFYLHFGLQKDLELELGHVVNSEFLYSLSTKTKQINKF